jgi:UDP-glucose 4-epimerase
MKADAVDTFYNVGTGKRTSIKELAEMVLRLTGVNREVEYEPGGLTFVKNRIGCPIKAREEIGFSADVELEAGLVELIEWRNRHKEEVASRRAHAAS